jgi:hypothetical protein
MCRPGMFCAHKVCLGADYYNNDILDVALYATNSKCDPRSLSRANIARKPFLG